LDCGGPGCRIIPEDAVTSPDHIDPKTGGRPGLWIELLGWLWLLAVAGFLALFLLPRKGVDFSDEGWILSASLAAARGWGLDLLIPQAPVWALNALVMAAGIDSYLAMRWLFYGLISLCLGVALVAITPPRGSLGLRAGLVTLAGLTALSSLISYNTTPPYLVLAGAGLILLAIDARRLWVRVLLAGLAGLCLATGGFLNFTMYPAALLSLGLVWLACRRPRVVGVTAVVMAAAGGVAILWYLHRIGLHNFLQLPAAHPIRPERFFLALRVMLEWAAPAGVAWILLRITFGGKAQRAARHTGRPTTVAAIILGVCLLFFLVLLQRLGIWQAGAGLYPVLRFGPTAGLGGLGLLEGAMPFTVIAVWAVAVLVLALVLCGAADESYRRVLLYSGCLYLCYLWQEFFSDMDPRAIPVYYAGPCLALGFYLLLQQEGGRAAAWLSGAAVGLTLAGGIAFSLYYNHPNLNSVMGEKVDVPIPKLRGLQETPQRLKTLQALYDAFEKYHCRGGTLISFQGIPLLYYLFEVQPPQGLEYIRVPESWFPERILKTLQAAPRWCVFVSWNWLVLPGQDRYKGRTLPVMEYLRSHSQKIVPLSAPDQMNGNYYNDFVLYIGPQEEPVTPAGVNFGR
jgi:hypothetical protein